MTMPSAVATGAGADTPTSVRPLRIGIGAGVLAALYLFVLYVTVPVPGRIIALVGGASDDFARIGGIEIVWAPPPQMSADEIEARLATGERAAMVSRRNDVYVVRVPGVRAEDGKHVAARIAKGPGGPLRFHEVMHTNEMRDLPSQLGLPMNGARPVDAQIDEWRGESGETQTDVYLAGETREAIDSVLARAAALGWKLPAGTHIAFEHIEPDARDGRDEQGGQRPAAWRTYVLADRTELDGSAIADAQKTDDPTTNRGMVLLVFTENGAATFEALTRRLVNHKLAIVVDDVVHSAPIINSAIAGGRASITMGGNSFIEREREADILVATLRAGVLPAGGELRSVTQVPAGDTRSKVWTARLLIAIGGGVIVGLLAWGAIRSLRPVRRRRPTPTSRTVPWARVGVTLLAPVAVYAVSRVPILGVDYAELEEVGGGSIKTILNAGILGLSPLITAYVLVEVISLIVPSWRRRRHAGALARRPLLHIVYVVSVVLVLLQGYAIVLYLEAFTASSGARALSGIDRALIIGSLGAATLALGLVAHAIRLNGLGNGFAALLVGGWIVGGFVPWLVDGPLVSAAHLLGGATLGAMLVPLLVAMRWRVSSVGEAPLRIPTSSIAPIADAAGLAAIVTLLGTLPVTELAVRASELIAGVTASHRLVFGLVVAATTLWSWLFARPSLLAPFATRVGLSAPHSATFWRATGLTTSLLVFVLTPTTLTYLFASSHVRLLTDPLLVGVVAAAVVDIVDDFHGRRVTLDVAWSLHHPQHADLVELELSRAEIPCHLSGSHVRTLLAFFGPYAPIDVLVPTEHLQTARERIAALLAR